MKEEILVVDDEQDIRDLIAGLLEDEGYQIRMAGSDTEALEAMKARQPALIILDVWLRGSELDGLQILKFIRDHYPDSQIIMISGHATIEVAIKAVRNGAYDFITKPFKSAELLHHVERALEEAKLRKENTQLKAQSGKTDEFNELIGESDAIQLVRKQVAKIAPTNARLLIEGEAGTGKSLVANLIHAHSLRANAPFITFNCAAHSSDSAEPALFGVEADKKRPRRIGALEAAHGGTLLLEEIEYLPPACQQKLNRFIHNNQFSRIGGSSNVQVEVRICATSQPNLLKRLEKSGFLGDLYHRIAVNVILMPPFHRRLEDLGAVTALLLQQACLKRGRRPLRLSGGAQSYLQHCEWHGNGYQLERMVDYVIANLAFDQQVISEALWDKAHAYAMETKFDAEPSTDRFDIAELVTLSLKDAREQFEKEYLRLNLQRHHYHISRTAQAIGMDRAALHRKIKVLGLPLEGQEE